MKREYDWQAKRDYEKEKEARENKRKVHLKYRMSNPSKYLLQKCKNRARSLSIEFNLTLDDMYVPEICPLLNLPFNYGVESYCPSVDRIDNTKGYIKGNIWIISTLANRMKSIANKKELLLFAEGIIKHQEVFK